MTKKRTFKVDDQQISLSETVFQTLVCTENITREFIKQTLLNIRLFDAKQRGYGSGNISKFGEQGVLVRSSDKMERLINLSKKPPAYIIDPEGGGLTTIEAEPGATIEVPRGYFKKEKMTDVKIKVHPNESIEDNWQDLSIYATIALLVRKGVWPK